jgi:thiol:disulfide interchange protein
MSIKSRSLLIAVLLFSTFAIAQTTGREIYPDPAQAKTELAAALKTASQTHKRILLDFGGNWCADCQVLDLYLHNEQNRSLLDASFILIHVNIGKYDANLDIAAKYQIPLNRGVPAVAVLSETGKLLYSQKSGEFESMRRMDPTAVTNFLTQWRPSKAGCSQVMLNC